VSVINDTWSYVSPGLQSFGERIFDVLVGFGLNLYSTSVHISRISVSNLPKWLIYSTIMGHKLLGLGILGLFSALSGAQGQDTESSTVQSCLCDITTRYECQEHSYI